jgi:hypothetical protein
MNIYIYINLLLPNAKFKPFNFFYQTNQIIITTHESSTTLTKTTIIHLLKTQSMDLILITPSHSYLTTTLTSITFEINIDVQYEISYIKICSTYLLIQFFFNYLKLTS